MALRSRVPAVWNPSRELSRLQHRIDRMFDEFLTEPFPSLFRPTREFLPEEMEFTPACDVEETDTHFLLSFDLPGIKKEDLKIDLQENQLTVSGERKEEKKEETKGRVSRERYYGSFTRSFTLPSNVDANKIDANYESGVLQISLAKTAAAAGKRIPIKEGKMIESKAQKGKAA